MSDNNELADNFNKLSHSYDELSSSNHIKSEPGSSHLPRVDLLYNPNDQVYQQFMRKPTKDKDHDGYSISTTQSPEDTPNFDNLAQVLVNEKYNEKRNFFLLKLKAQIKPFHIVAYYIMCFTILLVVQFIIQFLMFILQSPKYYNLPKNKVGEIAGNCGFIAEIFVIALDLVLGIIFDTVGRKTPTVIGLMMAGGSIIATPFFTEVYPGFLIMRVVMSLGIIPGVNTPLLPDYVQEKSLGLANAYQSVVTAAAAIFGSTVLIQLSRSVDLLWIFIGMGSFAIAVGIFLYFGINDVITLKKQKQLVRRSALSVASTPNQARKVIDFSPKSKGNQKRQLRKTLRQFWKSLRSDYGFMIAFLGGFSCKMSAIVCSLFGSLLIQENYEKKYGPGQVADDKAKDLLSLLFLIGNIVQVPLGLFNGYVADKRKVWVLLTINNILIIFFAFLMIMFLDTIDLGLLFGFVAFYSFHFTIYMLNLILLSKIVKPESRGTMFGAFGLVGSIGVLLINKIGGTLYDNHSHTWPFAICTGTFILYGLLCFIFGITGKLKV